MFGNTENKSSKTLLIVHLSHKCSVAIVKDSINFILFMKKLLHKNNVGTQIQNMLYVRDI